MPKPLAQLEVDLGVETGTIRPLHGVNLGPIQMNGFLDFSAIYQELGFPSVRLHDCPYAVPETVDVHSIFPFFDADPADPKNYRFAITDDYIQAILDVGAQVVYRLGETIEHYTRRKYFVHPPKDFQKWADICVHIIRHYNEGWADGFHHNIRYWEIWNEPWGHTASWIGTDEDYYRLYEIAAKTIKAHDPNLMVGGPTDLGGVTPQFGRGFLEHCRRTEAPLDFYSWHQYTMEPLEIVEPAKALKETLAQYGFAATESHLNEWNYLPAEGWSFMTPTPGGGKDADCIRRAVEETSGISGAAFDAAMLVYMQDCPIDVANFYWAREGYWGLFDQHGTLRKNFYAFKAFRSLLDTPRRVRTTPNDAATGYAVLAGVDAGDRAGVLLANCRAREADFTLTVKGWPWAGKVICRRYLLDYDRNLELVGEETLDDANHILNLCMPAPACCYLSISPEESN